MTKIEGHLAYILSQQDHILLANMSDPKLVEYVRVASRDICHHGTGLCYLAHYLNKNRSRLINLVGAEALIASVRTCALNGGVYRRQFCSKRHEHETHASRDC